MNVQYAEVPEIIYMCAMFLGYISTCLNIKFGFSMNTDTISICNR